MRISGADRASCRCTMDTFKPDGHSITPRSMAQDAQGRVDFIRSTFSATGDYHSERPARSGVSSNQQRKRLEYVNWRHMICGAPVQA